MSNHYPLVVSGASGKLGQKVVNYLLTVLKVPADQIIALTRTPAKLDEFSAQGVQVRKADFDDAATLETAFAGGKRLLIISTDALDAPGHRLQQHRNAIQAAEKADIAHVLYTSMPKPEGSTLLIAPDHEKTEQAVKASNMSWTILRNNWYFENIFLDIHHILASGTWATAAGQGRIAHLAHDDAALGAATALAVNDFSNKTYTFTGEEAFSTDELAALISTTTGKTINVVHVTDAEKIAGMVAAGLPEPVAQVFESFDTNTRNGGVEDISRDFETLTGRKPMAYRDWLETMKDALLNV